MKELPAGAIVRMTRACRKKMRWSGSRQHIREFGRCEGMVLGLVDYNNCKPGEPDYDPNFIGPEVDVRWQPSNLRYMYNPDDLEIVK